MKEAFTKDELKLSKPLMWLMLPVLISVIISSVIYRFSFFYILIPGFWCYVVGDMLVNGIKTGSLSDNHGTAIRSKQSIRFWGKFALWTCAYIFATSFPVGYAIQERNKGKLTEPGNREVRETPAENLTE
jgi:hypothetical protein